MNHRPELAVYKRDEGREKKAKYQRSSGYCTIYAVPENQLMHPQLTKKASYRHRLVEVGRSRDAIMVEEFGRGTQCAKASLLRVIGSSRPECTSAFIPVSDSTKRRKKKVTRNDLMVSTARMAASMFEGF
jgi:hypothetical protein